MPCVDLRSEVKTGYIRPFAPAVLRGKEIRKFAAEKCQSGRSGLTRNQVYLHGYRGFESLLFRTAHRPRTEAHRTGPAGPVFFAPKRAAGPRTRGEKRAQKARRMRSVRREGALRRPCLPRADAPPPPGTRAGLRHAACEQSLFRTAQGPHTEAHRTGPAGPVFLRPNAPPGPARAARKGRKKPAACAACGGKVR